MYLRLMSQKHSVHIERFASEQKGLYKPFNKLNAAVKKPINWTPNALGDTTDWNSAVRARNGSECSLYNGGQGADN